MSLPPAAGGRGFGPGPAGARPPAGEAEGGVAAAAASSLPSDEPVDRRASRVFFGYPLVMSVYLSFTHYDLLNPPRWVGLANYRYLFNERPADLAGDQEHALDHRRRRPAAGAVRLRHRADAHACAGAASASSARSSTCPRSIPPVAATLGFVYILNPATGPVNTILGELGINGPLWFNDPGVGEAVARPARALGHRQHMIIFLAAILDVPRHLYESAELDGAGPFQRLR